jgi:hypothetical protein
MATTVSQRLTDGSVAYAVEVALPMDTHVATLRIECIDEQQAHDLCNILRDGTQLEVVE